MLVWDNRVENQLRNAFELLELSISHFHHWEGAQFKRYGPAQSERWPEISGGCLSTLRNLFFDFQISYFGEGTFNDANI